MSWRPAIVFSVALAVLLPFYLLVDRNYAHSVQMTVEKADVLGLEAIDGITVTRGAETAAFHKTPDGKLFQIVSPAGAFVPQDLMNAMTSLLVRSREVEVIADSTDDLSQYGLDHPRVQMDIHVPGKPAPVQISLGNENPTHTAVYAAMAGSRKIFLLGMDLKYYQDLMFEWVEGKQGKKA